MGGGLRALGAAVLLLICVMVDASPQRITWSYHRIADGMRGPEDWHVPYTGCAATGRKQSPVDVASAPTALRTHSLQMDCATITNLTLQNTQHSIVGVARAQAGTGDTPTPPPPVSRLTLQDTVVGEGLQQGAVQYSLASFHIHSPSEHTLDGKAYDMELHFVHADAKGTRFSVVGVLFDTGVGGGVENPWLATLLRAAGGALPQLPVVMADVAARFADQQTYEPTAATHSVPARDGLSVCSCVAQSSLSAGVGAAKLDGVSYIRYEGSLTTPNCSEVVQWNVVTKVQPISQAQLGAFKAALGFSAGGLSSTARPVQPLHGRPLRYYIGTAPTHSTQEQPKRVTFGTSYDFLLPVVATFAVVLSAYAVGRHRMSSCNSGAALSSLRPTSPHGSDVPAGHSFEPVPLEHMPSIEVGSSVESASDH
eukprot:TRINITY_DN21800_c4_g2_i1.p2 TRINITY_DN21800_c4_g2~~TRINITY_DN21800_c4_g2_i1.p2  ORF type:complete len:465 (+),score=135.44 TRINITY_DN21800_c4_g2_i1:124-1395(+)